VYEISNGNLQEKTISDFQDVDYCELVFISSGRSLESPIFANSEAGAKYGAGRLVLTVPTNQSDDVIVKTIRAGWTLKEIRRENNI
jgi:hypothetical protein